MNATIKNGDLILSKMISIEEALIRLEKLKMIYPNARIVETDEEIIERRKINVTPEEIEDVGCAVVPAELVLFK